MNGTLRTLASALQRSRVFRWALWVGFAVIFYHSGLALTTWLVEPDRFGGGLEWGWMALFPLLISLFFAVNRRCGCAGDACAGGCTARGYRFPPGH